MLHLIAHDEHEIVWLLDCVLLHSRMQQISADYIERIDAAAHTHPFGLFGMHRKRTPRDKLSGDQNKEERKKNYLAAKSECGKRVRTTTK